MKDISSTEKARRVKHAYDYLRRQINYDKSTARIIWAHEGRYFRLRYYRRKSTEESIKSAWFLRLTIRSTNRLINHDL